MSHLLYRIGNFAGRHPWRIIAAWVFLAGAVFMLNSSHGGEPDETSACPAPSRRRAADAIQDRFPQETLYSSNVILHSDEGLTSPATRAAVEQAVQQARRRAARHRGERARTTRAGRPSVRMGRPRSRRSASTPRRSGSPSSTPPRRPSRASVTRASRSSTTGAWATRRSPAGGNSEMIGILMAVVILAIAFGSLVAMSLPIVAALTAIVVGSSAIGIMSGIVAGAGDHRRRRA